MFSVPSVITRVQLFVSLTSNYKLGVIFFTIGLGFCNKLQWDCTNTCMHKCFVLNIMIYLYLLSIARHSPIF